MGAIIRIAAKQLYAKLKYHKQIYSEVMIEMEETVDELDGQRMRKI